MIQNSPDITPVVRSVKVYRLLLKAYPAKFQQEYGSQMILVFQDCCMRALRQGGMKGMVGLWAVMLLDFLQSVISEHTRKETDMSKSKLIKFSGWAFILGSFAFVTILSGSDAITIPGSVISAFLLAIGLLGLRARYGEQVGGFGRNILLLGASAPILWVLLGVFGTLMWVSGNLTDTQIEKGPWILIFGAPAFVLLGLTMFGLAGLRTKPMSRLHWLPVVAGFWYPLVYLFLATYVFTRNGVYPQQYHTATQLLFLMQFVALCVFGAIVAADIPQETATA